MRLMIIPVLGLAVGGGWLMGLGTSARTVEQPVEKWTPSEAQKPDTDKLDEKQAQLAAIREQVAAEKRNRIEMQRQNVARYLNFKGWKCGDVYWHKRHETNRIGLTSNEIRCMDKTGDGSAMMRGYLITMSSNKWGRVVEHGKYEQRDGARISSAPVP